MSIKDTFIRVNRHRANDGRTARLSLAAWAVLDQVWAIAADEGQQDGEDVLVDARKLMAGELLFELPRSTTVEDVERALSEITSAGCIAHELLHVRVHKLAAYNAVRFRKRAERAERKASRESCPANDVRVQQMVSPDGGAVAGAGAGEKAKTSARKRAGKSAKTASPGNPPSCATFDSWAWACWAADEAKARGYVVTVPRSGWRWTEIQTAYEAIGHSDAKRIWLRWLDLADRKSWLADGGVGFPQWVKRVNEARPEVVSTDPVGSFQTRWERPGSTTTPALDPEAASDSNRATEALRAFARGRGRYGEDTSLGSAAADAAVKALGGVTAAVRAFMNDGKAATSRFQTEYARAALATSERTPV